MDLNHTGTPSRPDNESLQAQVAWFRGATTAAELLGGSHRSSADSEPQGPANCRARHQTQQNARAAQGTLARKCA